MGKLNAKRIKGLTEKGRYGDGDNLYLCVGRGGRKSWALLYTIAGQNRQMGLGPLDDDFGLTEARDRAAELRRMIRRGVDPLAEKRAERAKAAPTVVTFREVAEDCIAALVPGWTNGKSEGQWRQSLTTYAYPVMGNMDVAAITTDEVYRVLEPIWATKPETAGRVRARIEKVLDRATARKLRTGDNPARLKGNLDHLLAKQSKVKRVKSHAALPYAEVSGFMAEVRKREGVAARAFEFAILTAARTNEALGATWSEIDLDAAVWTIPADRMKARRDHRVPLSDAAVALLRSMPRDESSDYVFISPMAKGKPLSNMALLATLKRMERTDLTAHGFRSTFRDWAAETTAYPDAVVEMALAHAISNAVEAAYRRGDLFEKRKRLMADWAAYCSGRGAGADKVVPIRAA
ncbi:site-specific integrase [uncultured Sphingomonas sp.]|uniref:tyrosine-type recombinase/integrase n=1 Tax=uncultured Sphingomonas sp. TaxID=158754 RepID=UPI0025D11979|nr:site-specific integrase [uncultured Sphingomonas sp.]